MRRIAGGLGMIVALARSGVASAQLPVPPPPPPPPPTVMIQGPVVPSASTTPKSPTTPSTSAAVTPTSNGLPPEPSEPRPSGLASQADPNAAVAPSRSPAVTPTVIEAPVAYGGGTTGPASPSTSLLPSDLRFTPIGYVEVYYQYNFNRPSNGISNALAFDNRHNSFTLSNAVLGGDVAMGPVTARLTLQVGATPSTYYQSEPTLAAASDASGSNGQLWKYLQEAYVGYRAPVGNGINLQAGLFLTPIGPESMAVKDNWTWSRSNVFFGLPFYMTGARATYALDDRWTVSGGVFNGWNSVVDNNEEKSVEAHLTYRVPDLTAQVLYFGGVERNTGAPEGPYWRHQFDAFAQGNLTSWLAGLVEGNAGFEPNRFGTSSWAAAQISARARLSDTFAFAARGDRFYEHAALNAEGDAAPIFWGGARWVSEGTATLEMRPVDHILFRLEYRHDQSGGDLYFRSNVQGDGSSKSPYVPNARSQDTLTLGATAWL